MTTKTTVKTLTDDDGDTLEIDLWAPGCMSLTIYPNTGDWAVSGPFDPADLIAAIREVAGEADEPAPAPVYQHVHVGTIPTAEDFSREQFARHEDGRIAARLDTDSAPWAIQPATSAYDWLSDAEMAAEGWSIVTPAPSTPREALALAVDLAYEPEGDAMPDQPGYMKVGEDGRVEVLPTDNPVGMPARGTTYRRLLLDPPAPVTPAWHNARIVEAVCRGRVGQWARTATGGLWVSLDGESREAYTPDLTNVTVVVPEEVEA